jgi:oligoendopeptidase F
MNKRSMLKMTHSIAIVLVVAGMTISLIGQERDRAKIADKYKWNLAEVYPSDAAWRAAKEKLTKDLTQMQAYKGKLGTSASVLADALEKSSALDKELARLYTYASMSSDQDTRDAMHLGMKQEMTQLAAAEAAENAYIEPEILRFEKGTVEKFIASEPRLKTYRFYLEDIARRGAHTLSEAEEKLLADSGPLASAVSNTYNVFSNADFPFPTITLSDGKTVKLDQAAFADLRALPTRSDREKVMSEYFGALGKYSGTFGTTMSGEVLKVAFLAKARKYESALQYSLDGPNIPVPVYQRLIEGINKNLPAFHRYLKLRTRMMKLDQLHYYDLYAPLVGSVNLTYTPEEAQHLVLAAVAPLGAEYVNTVQKAFDSRWIDLFPNDGKRAGAYSDGGAYDVHPYMLINYNGKYADVTTLAHEMGHTMQSYFSNKTQPYALANYPIFVAEVASTFNETLLINHVLKNTKDDDIRLALLGNYLENIKGTVFRQAQFAEFELRMHEMAAKGQAITGQALAKLYLDITRKYYGQDKGVCIVDDYVANEWSYVPHFYRDFYVYQYSTSFTASMALAEKVQTGDPAALKRYLAFLSAGGSKYPIDLLKDAGVDMTTDEPLDLTVKAMNRVMDEMESILAKKKV